ncbi:MAG TPA: diguanylate cyclase domain-containing protein [Xenococcaceae cyanobacterium]
MIQVLGAVGLVGYLSFRNGQISVANLAEQLMLEVGNRISERLNIYLATPHIVNQLNQDAIDLGYLDLEKLSSMEQHFWRQSQIFDLVSYIQFGNVEGEFVGLAINDDGTFRYQVTEFTGALQTYAIDESGNREELLETSSNFDSRRRPWYIVPQQADRPAWTEIYSWVNPPTLAITLGQPYYDVTGKFQGILAADLTLAQISEFLKSLKIGESGQTFIIEPSGLLVATSANELPFTLDGKTPKRLDAVDSQNFLTRATVNYLKNKFSDLSQIKKPTILSFQVEGERYFLQINPLRDEQGLNWLGIIVIPESDFMAQININTRITILLCLSALGLAIISGIYTSRWITRPIQQLIEASQAIASGNLAQNVDRTGVKELNVLTDSFNQMARQLQASFTTLAEVNQDLEAEISDRQQIEAQLRHSTLHDALTNFPNRTFLMEHLEIALSRVQREENYLFAVLFVDLDRFKVINDSLGHQAGDQLLIAITHKFASMVRASDIIARLGGDEFVILLDPIKDISDAIRIAERINQELQNPLELDNHKVLTSASIGITLSSPNYHQGSELLRDADIAMYRAKSKGKAQYELFNQEMYSQAIKRLQLEHDLYQ